MDPNLRTLPGSEPSCMLHGGQPSWTLLPPAIAAAVGVPAGRRHGPRREMRRVSHLPLHPSPEAPDACIVPAAGPPGHGLPDSGLPGPVPAGPCGMVGAPIRACPDVVGKDELSELVICVQHEPLLHRDGAFAGKQHICLAVRDSGHADEALVHAWEAGDVGGDGLEGSAAPEVPVHGIGRHLGLPSWPIGPQGLLRFLSHTMPNFLMMRCTFLRLRAQEGEREGPCGARLPHPQADLRLFEGALPGPAEERMQDAHPLHGRQHAHGRKGRKAGRLPGARHSLAARRRASRRPERPCGCLEADAGWCAGHGEGLRQPLRLPQESGMPLLAIVQRFHSAPQYSAPEDMCLKLTC